MVRDRVFMLYKKVPKSCIYSQAFGLCKRLWGLNAACPLVVFFLSRKVLKGFKNRWMESTLGWGSLCVTGSQEANWLAPTVSCTLRKGHRLNSSQSTSLHVHSQLFKYGIPSPCCRTPLRNDPLISHRMPLPPAQPSLRL